MKTTVAAILALVLAAPVFAERDVDFGIRVGFISGYSQTGLQMADHDLSRLNLTGGQVTMAAFPKVNLIIAADYGQREQEYRFVNQDFRFRLEDLAVTVSAVYPLKFNSIEFLVGAGVGSHSISYEYFRPITLSLADNGVTIPSTTTYFGYHALAGIRVHLPDLPGGLFAEGRLVDISTPGDNISFTSWAGGIFVSLP